MREIPKLQLLCLRVIGSHSCNAEETFAKCENGEPSSASRLLRAFHERPIDDSKKDESKPSSVACVALRRTPCIGRGSSRREQGNDVDLNHPVIACKSKDDPNVLVMEYGSPALDCLQCYIDALVDLGRMDDTRLGVHFFEEWKSNVMLGNNPVTITRKRRRGSPSGNSSSTVLLGSLSLHNAPAANDTIGAMVESGMGACLGVLDLTGMRSLTDELVAQILPKCPHLHRLSLKNCRRLTAKSLKVMGKHQKRLVCLDIGGSYNIAPQDILQLAPKLQDLTELHASGLGWTDDTLDSLVDLREWKALSLGFSVFLSANGLKRSLPKVASSLESLALPFCEHLIENATLGVLGRHLPLVRCLDLRGNHSLATLTGWYDGRVSADLPEQELLVLARYSGISKNSLEETRKIHPVHAEQLTCILDGSGTGSGIMR